MYVKEFACASGMGCAECGGTCGQKGMGNYVTVKDPISSYRLQSTINGHGLGLFDSMDFTTWTWTEWALAAGAAYIAVSVVHDLLRIGGGAKRGAQKTARAVKRSYRKGKRAQAKISEAFSS
jgi:hypothetical protein